MNATENGHETPVLFEADIHHLCWFCDLTEKNRDATIVSNMSSVEGNIITNLIQLTSPTPQKDIEFMRGHKLVKSVEVLMLQPNSALLRVVSSYEAMTYKILHQTNVALLESPVTSDGTDSEILLAKSHKAMSIPAMTEPISLSAG